ncbi:hypothetical protein AWH62_03195 [Maricaulis sp. W15]|nr:hypothetical protein AWH62_03195 [Maricaulis sp. W15]
MRRQIVLQKRLQARRHRPLGDPRILRTTEGIQHHGPVGALLALPLIGFCRILGSLTRRANGLADLASAFRNAGKLTLERPLVLHVLRIFKAAHRRLGRIRIKPRTRRVIEFL